MTSRPTRACHPWCSPPLTLTPAGQLAACQQKALPAAEAADPVPEASKKHEGPSFVVTFAGGNTVRIKRMHAAH
ncbi:MAG TPA: hypothetical protein VN043_07055 [Rhodanobacter sp.]|nr:hypothetical protein [Rhodanobacter sp.]